MKKLAEYMKKCARWIWIPIVAILIGCAGEVVYNMPFEKQDDYQYIGVDDIEMDHFHLVEGSSYVSDGGEATLTMKFDKQYVDKFTYTFASQNIEIFTCDIVVNTYQDGKSTGQKVITDQNNYMLTQSMVNVRATTDQIQIKTRAESGPVKISKIAINNTGNISEARFAFVVIVSFFGLTILVCWKRKYKIELEYMFLAITLLVGSLSVCAMPSHKVGADEEIHFGRAYFLGDAIRGEEKIEYPYGIGELINVRIRNLPMNRPQSEEEQKEENNFWNEAANYREYHEDTWEKDTNYRLQMSSVAYIVPFLFMKAGMLFKLPFVYIYKLGRLAGVLLYALLGFFAIKHLKYGKRILFLFALMPTAMMAAITYSYDVWVNGFMFLGFAYLIEMWFDGEKKISWKEYIIMLVSFVFASMPKAVYIPMVLLFLLIPGERFQSRKDMHLMKGFVIAAFLVMMSSFVWPAASGSKGGDSRGGDTSVTGQMVYMFSHPFVYVQLLLKSIGKNLYSYTIGMNGLAQMGHYEKMANTSVILIALLYTIVTDKGEEDCIKVKIWQRICILTVCFGVLCLIWTAMYLSFTPVGLNQINGVQGRYYLPVTIWGLWSLRNTFCINRLSEARDNLIITGFSLAILLPIVYSLIIVPTF